MVARGIRGAVARSIAVRFGAEGAASLLGLSLSGWGLVLLGAGVITQIVAIEMTPTAIQQWAKQSYFGKGDKKFPVGDWKAEFEALQKALHDGVEDTAHEATEAAGRVPAEMKSVDWSVIHPH